METANKLEPGISSKHAAQLLDYHAQDSQTTHCVTQDEGSIDTPVTFIFTNLRLSQVFKGNEVLS
jgi:hypothetical protein